MLEIALHKSSTGIIKRVDVVDDDDKTVLRRPVVRNKEYIRRIMEAKNDGADEAFVDKLIEVAKLTKKVRLIPASKLIAKPSLKRSRPKEFWSEKKRTRTVCHYKNRRKQKQPQPPPKP